MTDIPQSTEAMELGRWSRLIKWLPKSIKDVLRSVFDTSTFASPTYILLTVSTSLTMLGESSSSTSLLFVQPRKIKGVCVPLRISICVYHYMYLSMHLTTCICLCFYVYLYVYLNVFMYMCILLCLPVCIINCV